MPKICPKCGANNEDDTTFCTNCNERIGVVSNQTLMTPKDFEKSLTSEGRSYIPITESELGSVELNKKTTIMIVASVLLIVLISSTIIVPWFSVNQNVRGPASINFAYLGGDVSLDIQYDFNLKDVFVKYSTASSLTFYLKSSFPPVVQEYNSEDNVGESMGLLNTLVIIGIVFSIISCLTIFLLIMKKIPKKIVIPFVLIFLIISSFTLISFITNVPSSLDETLEKNDYYSVSQYLFLYPLKDEFNGELSGSTKQYVSEDSLSSTRGFFADSTTIIEMQWGPSVGFYMIVISFLLSFLLFFCVLSWVDPKKFKKKIKEKNQYYPE